MNDFRTLATVDLQNDFASQLRREMEKREGWGRQGVDECGVKNYWMNDAVFNWCCNHAEKSGIAPAQYAAAFYNTNIDGNTIYFPSAFRASYAKQKGLMDGMKSAISASLQP